MAKVTIFALSTCPWCKKAQQYFTERNIAFESLDYDLAGKEDKDMIIKEMTRRGGGRSFPFVIIGEIAVEGFNPDKFEQCLKADENPDAQKT
jgi:glutaredoxin